MLPSTCGDVAWCLVHLRHKQPQGDRGMGPNTIHHAYICPSSAVTSPTSVLDRITDTAKASDIEWMEAGYESMAHFIINTEDVADMLRGIDFQTGNGFTAMMTPSLSHIHSCLFASASWSCSIFRKWSMCFCCRWRWGRQRWWSPWRPNHLTWSDWWIRETHITYF